MVVPPTEEQRSTSSSEDHLPTLNEKSNNEGYNALVEEFIDETFNPNCALNLYDKMMDEKEGALFMETNSFSPDSGFESSVCPSPLEFNSAVASDYTNYNYRMLNKRSRNDSLEGNSSSFADIPMVLPPTEEQRSTSSSEDHLPTLSEKSNNEGYNTLVEEFIDESFNPNYAINLYDKMIDEKEEALFMETNLFSVDSGFESSICSFPPEFNSAVASDNTNYEMLNKRSRNYSLEDNSSSFADIPMVLPPTEEQRSTSSSEDHLPTLNEKSNNEGYKTLEEFIDESFNPNCTLNLDDKMMDEKEEALFMETNLFSAESGFESSICPFPPEFNSADASDFTNYAMLNKRSRNNSLEENSSNCAGDTNSTVTLQSEEFQLKLFKFRAETHCSLDVDVSIVSNSNMKRYKIMKLVEVTMSFLKPLFEANSIVCLTKRKENVVVKEQFSQGLASSKRAVVSCQHMLKGVALHLIDIELQKLGGTAKKTNNKFSHYSRPDRNAGDVLTADYAKKYGVDVNMYTVTDIEEKMQISLMIFDFLGYLKYSSAEMREINCTFYESNKSICLVKENMLKAFGSCYNLKKK